MLITLEVISFYEEVELSSTYLGKRCFCLGWKMFFVPFSLHYFSVYKNVSYNICILAYIYYFF
jgi:hypothetical protein